jgi:glycosyltransferase involved in cell wall biosynthesis
MENKAKVGPFDSGCELLSQPLVSVIVPAYNHEKYITSCLDSIALVDYPHLELLIIDDGSKDETFIIANDWIQKNRTRFFNVSILKQENIGICKTLNKLVMLAEGEYILPIASDDMLLKNAITSPLHFAMTNQKEFVVTDAELMDMEGRIISVSALSFFGKNRKRLLIEWLFEFDVILAWRPPYQHYLAKRKLLIELGMFNENLCYEDLDMVLKALACHKVGICLESTWKYRINLDNRLTNGLSIKSLNESTSQLYKENYPKFSGFKKILLLILILSTDDNSSKLKRTMAYFLCRILKKTHTWIMS